MGAPKLSAAERTAINRDNMRFSAYILIILSAIVVGIAIYRVIIHSVRYIRTLICLNDDRQQFFKLPNRTFGWIKRYIIYAPLFNRRHSKQMRVGPVQLGTLPTRFQSMLLTGIIAMNVTLCVYGIEWNGPLNVKLWHLRNRSGTLSVVNMIPLVLMAGRNNPLIGLLNVSFNTFNLLHRWFGRIVVALAVTHGIVEIIDMVIGATAGKKVHPSGITIFTQSLQEARFLLWGFVATVAMITIILTSFTSFRHAFYETFLHIHIALVSLTMAGLWIHLKGLQQINHLKAVIAIWIAERIIRFFSLVYRNIGRTTTTADIEALPGDAMRITLRLTRPVRFKPGQYIFLTIPSVGLWTSHPFSIAWSESSNQPQKPQDLEKAYTTHTSNDQYTTSGLLGPQTTISLLVRRRSGFTSNLHSRLPSTSTTSFHALFEGPYGPTPSLSSYGTILLIAGGIGITAHLTPLRHLLSTYSTAATSRISLIWILRSPTHLEWIRPQMTEILAMPKRRELLRIRLFVTNTEESVKELQSPSATVQLFLGRPDVDALVEGECREQVGAMGVSVCGPGGLGDDVRAAVRRRQGWRNVDFWEEGYGW